MNRNVLGRLPAAALTLLAALCGHAAAESFSVEGMIGQVNGRAIFSRDVIDEQLGRTLADWGRELSRTEFRQRAGERIAVRLNSIVTDALIFGEAQRDLSDQERQGLTYAVARQREKLLRLYGQGSAAVAEAELVAETGMGLDQTLERWRQSLVVQRYMAQKLRPKVNVTRKDIKRYYKENHDEFNPPQTRTVRVIQTHSGADSQAVADQLAAGTPFADVAADAPNLFRPASGGMMGPMAGDQLFASAEVNDATLALEAGGHAGPFTVGDRDWFIFVEKIDQAEGRSLMDVQTQIQALLFEQQYRTYTERYREELFAKGSYNSIDQMTLSLVEIAEDRYLPADR